MRAVCYARVSSAEQRDRDTIASQLRVLPEFIAARGWTLAAPVTQYVDDGRTAKAGHLAARTGFSALLRDAAAGLFDVVVVIAIDRITRSEDLAERGAIFGALQRAGVKLAASTSGQVLDLSTSSGDLFTSLHAYFAAEWSRLHKERIRQGRITGVARGHKPRVDLDAILKVKKGAGGTDEKGALLVAGKLLAAYYRMLVRVISPKRTGAEFLGDVGEPDPDFEAADFDDESDDESDDEFDDDDEP